MLTNITIGQYYPTKSHIHSMDSRVKLLATMLHIGLLFFINNFVGYALVILAVSMVIYASNVPPGFIFRGLRAIFVILLFTVSINVFFNPEGQVLIEVWKLRVTTGGLVAAGMMATRLVLLIIGSSILTLTTSPIELTDALEYLLKPTKKIGIPAHEIAMMMTIALRFIPTLLEELDKIMKAQMARGADFDTGGLMKKAKSMVPLLVPLFVSSFRRAEELAMAMEARCYRGDINRTRMKEMRLKPHDHRALAFLAVYVVVVVATRVVRL